MTPKAVPEDWLSQLYATLHGIVSSLEDVVLDIHNLTQRVESLESSR